MKLPKTLWGFPVEDEGVSTAALAHARAGKGKGSQRGIAMIIAILIISVMMLFTSDMIVSSQVNMSLATRTRDNLKAEYMAKSALNAATLLLSSDFAYQLFQAQQDPKATFSTGLGDIWSVMNGLPIGGETLDMMNSFQEQFGLNSVMDSSVLDQLKEFDGQWTLTVSDESSKINVNNCANGRCEQTMLMLEALFSCPAEKQFLESKKLNGRELAFRIKDYVYSRPGGTSEASGFNDKNEPYQKRTPKQLAKQAPLDSVDELRMIEGWDEEMQAVFGPYLTAWPMETKSNDPNEKVYLMNVNTASRALLQCLFPESRGDCNEKATLALKKRNDDAVTLGQQGQKVGDVLKDTLCYTGSGDGKEGEANNRAGWFSQSSMVFRVEADGVVGDSKKHLTVIVQRVMPDPKKNEKATFKVLYWKMT